MNTIKTAPQVGVLKLLAARRPNVITVAIILGLFGQSAFANTRSYTGNRDDLVSSTDSRFNFPTGLVQDDNKGYIYTNGGATVVDGADVTINYLTGTAPQFVIGGYSCTGEAVGTGSVTDPWSGIRASGTGVGNQVSLEQGQIAGSVWGGLSHISQWRPSVDLSSNAISENNSVHGGFDQKNDSPATISVSGNSVVVGDNVQVTGNVYGAQASLAARVDDLKGGSSASSNSKITADSSVSGGINWTEFNQIEASENSVTVSGQVHDIYGGYALMSTQIGNLEAGDSSAVGVGTSNSSMQASVFGANAIANSNTVSGNQSHSGNVYGGFAAIDTKIGHQQAGITTATGENNPYSTATALVFIDMQAQNATANANNVSITGAAADIYGGAALSSLQVGDSKAGTAYGGDAGASGFIFYQSSHVDASSNNVTIAGNASNIYGGSADVFVKWGDWSGGQSANSVVWGGSAASGGVQTMSHQATANSNDVSVNNSTVQDVYGGSATILINGGNIQGGTATYSDFFARSEVGLELYVPLNTIESNDNRVTLNSSTADNVYGGFALFSTQFGDIKSGVTIAENVATDIDTFTWTRLMVSAGGNSIDASFNQVLINGSVKDIYGGKAAYSLSQTGEVQGATLTVTNPGALFAGPVDSDVSLDAGSSTVTSNHNIVAVNGSAQNIYGGSASFLVETGNIQGGIATINGDTVYGNGQLSLNYANTTVQANDNQVMLNGALAQGGSIYGGYTEFTVKPGSVLNGDNSQGTINISGTATSATATGNTITLADNASIAHGGDIYGGYLVYDGVNMPETFDVFTGNTLNVNASKSMKINNLGNIEHYHFSLSPDLVNTGVALIDAQNVTFGSNEQNLSTNDVNNPIGSTIDVVGIHSGQVLQANDRFVLINAQQSMTGLANGGVDNAVSQLQQGISLLYDVTTTVDYSNNQVIATINGCKQDSGEDCPERPVARVNPQLKALLEGRLSAAMLVTRGADRVAYGLIDTIKAQNGKNGFSPFIDVYAGNSRYNSGSHITADEYLLTAGISYRSDHLAAALISEEGWGSYDSYNQFDNAASVHGNGNNHYYGFGLLGRYQFDSGLYSEASVRIGRISNRFDTNDLVNLATGEKASYVLKSDYFSYHVGVGYVLPVNDMDQLDLSAKYLWSRLAGKNAIIAGDAIHFDRIDSDRLRLNLVLQRTYSKNLQFNVGVGYEYEFDGKAKAQALSTYNIDAPSVQGSTGIISLGTMWRSAYLPNLSVKADIQGYIGKRERGSVGVRVNYDF
ncbi:hypothetical protein DES39_1871 [Orbus hercynius]|uniref:Autotransporter domain-containing protein n=1 Tax=Orbus hercynius TaxID=593135 RepID=A0A495RBN0_9GAMM|nr:autotransporter outer membrane beta-barrel domain-containing protein [Orbus hercynius]RKS84660.1 hypothetical protein DES39_1871 [Orbus hercynius]